jgi:hypothetical protein
VYHRRKISRRISKHASASYSNASQVNAANMSTPNSFRMCAIKCHVNCSPEPETEVESRGTAAGLHLEVFKATFHDRAIGGVVVEEGKGRVPCGCTARLESWHLVAMETVLCDEALVSCRWQHQICKHNISCSIRTTFLWLTNMIVQAIDRRHW